jgi:mannose receptor, C type
MFPKCSAPLYSFIHTTPYLKKQLFYKYSFIIAQEGKWIWFSTGQEPNYSSWGPNFPNTVTGNSDDCGLMAIQSQGYWWEDCNCLASDIQQRKIAPICQYGTVTSTTAATTSTTMLTTTSTAVTSCPEDWEAFNGHCYFWASEENVVWDLAEFICLSKGGYLASVHSEEEQEFVLSLVGDLPYWIGATCSGSEVQ